MPEANQVKWVGVRPVSPAESIPIVKGTDERKATAISGGATVSVGITSTTILAANTARVSYYIENVGSAAVYVYLSSPATTSHLTLNAGDFIYGEDYTGIITGIVASGSVNVYVIEV